MSVITQPALPTSVTATARSLPDKLFLACWVVAIAGVVATGTVLQPIWGSRPELADRFLIPVAAAWLIYRAWPRLLAAPPRPASWGLIPLVLGAGLFAVAWFLAVQVSGRPLVAWWLTLSLEAVLLGLTITHAGRFRAAFLIFPLAFCLFSLPTPGRVYNPLQLRMKQFTTLAAEKSLPWLGVSAMRSSDDSFELILPSGSLGVVEACSGVRSIIPLTAIAFFVAYYRGFGAVRWAVLVALTMGIVALVNSLRVIVTGLLQEFLGLWAIGGWRHEALGIGAVLIGFGLILWVSGLIAPRQVQKSEESPNVPIPLRSNGRAATSRGWAALTILMLALAACLWAEQFRVDHRMYMRLDEVSMTLGPWRGDDIPIPDEIKDELYCDQLMRRNYTNPLGQTVQVWVMFWGNSATTAHMHHPDICYPWRGWKVTKSNVRPIEIAPGTSEVPVSVRHYVKPQEQLVLYFWTQNGNRVLPDGVEAPEQFSGHTWVLRLLQGHQPIDRGARISVLIGAQTRGSIEAGEKLLREFTQDFAGDLYRVCPKAMPVTSPER